jgi:hypothetical protein
MPLRLAATRRRWSFGGHSAGAAHVGSFIAHAEIYADIPGAAAPVAAVVLNSGSYEFADPQYDVYFGPATPPERSSTSGLLGSKTTLFVVHAELDPELAVNAAGLLDDALTQAGREHRSVVVAKHGHMSEIYAVGTADESLSGPVLAFIRKYTK